MSATVAARSIRSIGDIVLRVPNALGNALDKVLALAELDMDHVTAECLVVAQGAVALRSFDIRPRPSLTSASFDWHFARRACDAVPAVGRRDPHAPPPVPVHHRCGTQGAACACALPRALLLIDALAPACSQTDAKISLLYLVGEHGDKIDNAPYILEPLIDGLKDERSPAVRLALLTATAKLFLKRPPEVQSMLGRLLNKELSGEVPYQTEPHDRALLYYRLLSHGVDAVRLDDMGAGVDWRGERVRTGSRRKDGGGGDRARTGRTA